ncbi:hypothetical protein HW450_10120 [Corynebacterium hindlerae]|uniref:Uncharacterized protein n=1 Tax=Corynebacterium hindlerae TaxID=699041 RepID=A0A7G5FDK2_9CORY|nr:hypothetical protein [Corynebacterium hindlerae]QMV84693.1 hypothetical protein HW450_10120 [Corynebacterium hindlerae]
MELDTDGDGKIDVHLYDNDNDNDGVVDSTSGQGQLSDAQQSVSNDAFSQGIRSNAPEAEGKAAPTPHRHRNLLLRLRPQCRKPEPRRQPLTTSFRGTCSGNPCCF